MPFEMLSLPSDVRSTFEGPPVWLISSASEDYLWCALQIPSSSSSSSREVCIRQMCALVPLGKYEWTIHVQWRCGLIVKLLWPLVLYSETGDW